MHQYQHAVEHGQIVDDVITLHDGTKAKVLKEADQHMKLIIKKAGKTYALKQEIEGEEACKLYYDVINSGEAHRVVYGANLK